MSFAYDELYVLLFFTNTRLHTKALQALGGDWNDGNIIPAFWRWLDLLGLIIVYYDKNQDIRAKRSPPETQARLLA